MAAQVQIPGVEPFNPHGEPTQVAQRWEKWKKSFEYLVKSSGIRDDDRKKALLLHIVGPQTQDVYETLGVEEDKTFEETLQELDEHFRVQKNVPFERSVFHNAKQK